MDEDDLLELTQVIGRGLQKAASTRQFLSSSRLAYWNYEAEVTDLKGEAADADAD
ncbi:MAG TPA: hypothetical protein VIJ51_14905 [Solirubrobacteraceae bacterium]